MKCLHALLSLCALPLALGACAGAASRSGAAAPRPMATAPRPIATALSLDARLLRMADARRADTLLLDSVLYTPETTLLAQSRRARAALLIGQLQIRSRYGAARRLLVHADTAVAAAAAFALGLARDTASVPALARALEGATDVVAAEAAWSLGRIGEPARAALVNGLRGDDDVRESTQRGSVRGPQVRAALLFAVSALRPVPTADVVPYLRDDDASVSFAAAYAIARPRAVSGTRALLALSSHPDAMVRVQVAAGAAHNATGDSLAPQAMAVLRVLHRDGDARVRVQATRALASHTTQANVRDLVLERARDSMAAVRVSAAEVLAPLIPRDSLTWRTLFNSDTTFMVRRALLDGAVRNSALLDALDAWRSNPDPWLRGAALELSANVPDALPPLLRLAWARRDRDERVRAAAVSALGSSGDSARVRDTLRAYLGDASPAVRAAALGALAGRATVTDVPLAMVRYATDTARGQHAVRTAALRLIAGAWRRDSLNFDPLLRAQLARLHVPSDPLVLRSVNGVTPLSGWFGADRHVRSLSEYERIVGDYQRADAPVRATLRTTRGDITLEFFVTDAPLTVDNFVTLARQGYFNGTRFHRVIPNFVAQDGDPSGTGSGTPGTSIRDEINRHRYERGAVGMALSGPDTGGSQYFLTITPQPHLDGGYTVFARVIHGLDAMDQLLLGDRLLEVIVR